MDVWSKNHQHYGYSLCVHWLYTCYCSALWDTMGALDNVHCGFRHDNKWLSPQNTALFKSIGTILNSEK